MWKNGIKSITLVCSFLTLVMCGHEQNPDSHVRASQNQIVRLSVLGDSVASGLFANTSLGEAFTNSGYLKLLSKFYAVTRIDSNSPDFYPLVDQRLGAPDDGAFGGIRDYSLSQRINKRTNQIVEMGRFAVSGTRTQTLSLQIDKLEKSFAPTQRKDDVIVLHVGSNDWCDDVSEKKFEENLRTNLERIARVYPHAKVLVLPLTDIARVLSLPDALAIGGNIGPVELQVSCSAMRKAEQLCLARDINYLTPKENVFAQQQSIARYNTIIKNIVSDVNLKSQKNNIKVAHSYENGSILEPSFLGLDCFHPGKRGHEAIADMVWPELETLLTTNF